MIWDDFACSVLLRFYIAYFSVLCILSCVFNLRVFACQTRSQEFDLGGYKLHDIEFVLGQGDKTTT